MIRLARAITAPIKTTVRGGFGLDWQDARNPLRSAHRWCDKGGCAKVQNMDRKQTVAGYWSSPVAFVCAAAAVVIGLGNVVRMPYLITEYGGGAFLLVYLIALLVMGLPLLVAELMLGRGARGDLVSMLMAWSERAGLGRFWSWAGYAALAGAAMVLSYYSVIAGWSLAYVPRTAAGALASLDAAGMRAQFLALVGDPEKGLGWHTMFMVVTTIFAAHGVRRGLEPALRRLLALMFLLLLVFVVFAATLDGAGSALKTLFQPHFAALGWQGVIEAIHQAFYTLTLGAGVMLAFGAYLRDDVELWHVGLAVVVLDTLFTLAAAFAVSSILATAGAPMSDGLGLAFESVPVALAQTGNAWFAMLFFVLLLLVSLTSALGLMEPVVMWLQYRFGMSRINAATTAGLSVWFLGLGTLLSFNVLGDLTVLGRTFFDWLSMLSTSVILPLFGIAMCLFVGRFLPAQLVAQEWGGTAGNAFTAWRWLLRYPARVGLIIVMLYALGAFAFIRRFW